MATQATRSNLQCHGLVLVSWCNDHSSIVSWEAVPWFNVTCILTLEIMSNKQKVLSLSYFPEAVSSRNLAKWWDIYHMAAIKLFILTFTKQFQKKLVCTATVLQCIVQCVQCGVWGMGVWSKAHKSSRCKKTAAGPKLTHKRESGTSHFIGM